MDRFAAVYRKYNQGLLYGTLTHRTVWDKICQELDAVIPYDYLFESFIYTPIDNKMIALVNTIKNAGIKTGIITDNKQDRVDAIIAYYNWYLLFDAIVISSRVGSGKEKESIFHVTLRLLSEEARDCVFIDNSEKNLLIPKQMGFSTIFYDDEKRPYTSLVNYINGL